MVVQGLIRPPPEIRAVVDHTAQFVANKGRSMENLIRSRPEGKTPKFGFLDTNSPYHAYYEDRIVFFSNGGVEEKDPESKESSETDEQQKEQPKTAGDAKTLQSKASAIDPVAKALLRQRAKISEYRSKQQKLVESQKEQQDADAGEDQKPATTPVDLPPPPRLEFLEIVAPASLSPAQIETIQTVAQFVALCETHNLLDHLVRAEWNNPAFGFLQPRHAHFSFFSALVDAYKSLRKNWNEESTTSLLTSTDECLEAVAYRAEYERDLASRRQPEEEATTAVNWHDFVVVETIEFGVDEVVTEAPPPPPPPPEEKEEVMVADSGEKIRVVPSYQPKVATHNPTMDTMIDPVSGQRVKLADMPEHMRIQLMDPKWAQERKRFQEKQKESNLVTDIAGNLERFAQGRGDRFGKKETTMLDNEVDPRKRQEEEGRLIRDQAHQLPVGPSLPGQEPPSKRPKLDLPPVQPMAAPPTQEDHFTAPSAPEDPFAAAATGQWTPTQTSQQPQELMTEEEFVQQQGGKSDITVFIRIPNDPSQRAHNFLGQTVPVTIGIQETTKTLKKMLAEKHLNGLSKLQLKRIPTGAFLKDSQTLAALNVADQTMLELVPRVRGRK